jgi:hypothetical protein
MARAALIPTCLGRDTLPLADKGKLCRSEATMFKYLSSALLPRIVNTFTSATAADSLRGEAWRVSSNQAFANHRLIA